MADQTSNLTIRNLTITPLALVQIEHLNSSHPAPSTTPQSDNIKELSGVVLDPFTETQPPIPAPNPDRGKRIRLTFEDSTTKHRYSCELPPSSGQRSVVLQPHHQSDSEKKQQDSNDAGQGEETSKQFTSIYLPHHRYLTLLSTANLSTWMASLNSSLPLSALSIPGTHNSPTCYLALPSVRCQAVPVQEQLLNGVRFLDVRVSCPPYNPSPDANHDDDPTFLTTLSLHLVHSAFPVSLIGRKHLSDLFSTLYSFLAAHPSETILLSLKREGTGKGTDHDLARIIHRHSCPKKHTSETSKWYTSPRIPTLGEVRGKIVLVRRYGIDTAFVPADEAGIDGSAWPDNVADGTCGSGTIRIQDYYGVMSKGQIQTKIRFAQEGLERAAAQRVHPSSSSQRKVAPLYINFLSASNFFNASCWPDRIAVKINPSMIEYLCMNHGAPEKGPGKLEVGDAATGIVVTDWVGHRGDWDLIRCIVAWNAKLQLRR
ncbi:hypothetical protein VTJ04DRAFT_1645 [Mycothermus thermophilus]|uniref:uncharacterized protein n=1 Tax=Humicola insolens TaxID=85995 RepID=UPI003742B208